MGFCEGEFPPRVDDRGEARVMPRARDARHTDDSFQQVRGSFGVARLRVEEEDGALRSRDRVDERRQTLGGQSQGPQLVKQGRRGELARRVFEQFEHSGAGRTEEERVLQQLMSVFGRRGAGGVNGPLDGRLALVSG